MCFSLSRYRGSILQKERHIVDLVVSVDYHIVKEGEELDKYQGFIREEKKLQNMKVTMIPIVVRALGTVPKRLKKRLDELEIKESNETIQTPVLKSTRIIRRVLEI